MCIGLTQQLRPVSNRTSQVACADEVEVVSFEGPVGFDVVDEEFEVRRDPGGLDGAEVGTDYSGVGVCVCEVDGPDTFDDLVRDE